MIEPIALKNKLVPNYLKSFEQSLIELFAIENLSLGMEIKNSWVFIILLKKVQNNLQIVFYKKIKLPKYRFKKINLQKYIPIEYQAKIKNINLSLPNIAFDIFTLAKNQVDNKILSYGLKKNTTNFFAYQKIKNSKQDYILAFANKNYIQQNINIFSKSNLTISSLNLDILNLFIYFDSFLKQSFAIVLENKSYINIIARKKGCEILNLQIKKQVVFNYSHLGILIFKEFFYKNTFAKTLFLGEKTLYLELKKRIKKIEEIEIKKVLKQLNIKKNNSINNEFCLAFFLAYLGFVK